VTRMPNPPPDPIVGRLGDPANLPDTEDVLALIGFVGPGRDGGLRIHADRDLQRWLEIPAGATKDSQQIDPGDELSRSVVWVDRQTMLLPIFTPAQSDGLDEAFAGAPLSTWNLIPETRLVAAQLLDLIPYGEEGGA